MASKGERGRWSVGFVVAGSAVLVAGLSLVLVHGATVVKGLYFVDEAVVLEAPGRYRVQAAHPSTWTLLQEASTSGDAAPIRVKVRAASDDDAVEVTASAAGYRYSRNGVQGFSAYDFRVPAAGEYDVELSSDAAVTMRLIDDVRGRLLHARRGMLRGAAMGGGAVALACALFAFAFLPRRRARTRVIAPRPQPLATTATATATATASPLAPAPLTTTPRTRAPDALPRGLQVLPALSTSVALERYNLPPPQKAPQPRPRVRPDTRRVPSVA